MEYKLRLIIIGVALFCLLPVVALGDSCIKTLYIDGNNKGSASATAELSMDDNRLTIGSNGNYLNLVDGLYGQIDEFAIYAGVLSDPCIVYHASFNQGNAGYVAAVLHDNPLLYFQFEDAASPNGAPVHNSGSVARDGTYIGVPGSEPNLVAGYIGKAVELYGYIDGNTTCIDVLDNDGNFFPEDGDVTIEFWTKVPDANGHDEWWFEHSNGGTQLGYGLGVHYFEGTDNYYNYIRGGGSTNPVVTYGTGGNQWHHVVVTYNSSKTAIGAYIEQVKMDDPCLWLRFEDFNDPCDAAGHDYWVEYGFNTIIGPEGGGIGNCIYFPGTGGGNYVAAANQSIEPPNAVDPCFGHQYAFADGNTTWEFWYRCPNVPDLPSYATFFNQSMVGGETQDINSPAYEMAGRVEDPPDGVPAVYTRYPYNRIGGASLWGYANQNPNMAIKLDNAWHHIVMSWKEKASGDFTMEFRLCIDGVTVKGPMVYPSTSPREGIIGGPGGEMDNIVIGRGGNRDRNGADGSPLIGYMDEFAIYGGGVLPLERVIAHYEAGLPKNCKELWERGLATIKYPEASKVDRDRDCMVDFFDFAEFAKDWALCNEPDGGPGCVDNW